MLSVLDFMVISKHTYKLFLYLFDLILVGWFEYIVVVLLAHNKFTKINKLVINKNAKDYGLYVLIVACPFKSSWL